METKQKNLTMKKTTSKNERGLSRRIQLIAPILITICLIIAFIETFIFISNFGFGLWGDVASWGQLGDFFGGTLNPLFSFCSLILLLITLNQNQVALESSADELRLSREEMSKSNTALENQAITLEKQRFEDTFFSLLNQHNLTLSEISQDSSPVQSSILHHIHFYCFQPKIEHLKDAKSYIIANNDSIGHYFRILYQLLKLIATSHPNSMIGLDFVAESILCAPITRQEKFYANIVRSFLNYKTMQLLAANCYCEEDTDTIYKFKLLVIRYQFFEHMPLTVNQTPHPALIESISHYGEQAFGDSEFLHQHFAQRPELNMQPPSVTI